MTSIAGQLADILADGGWRAKARPSQLPPAGDWAGWLVLAGRGFGKTWTGSNYIKLKRHGGLRWSDQPPPTFATS
jgi:phage terminase large subunit-like protein